MTQSPQPFTLEPIGEGIWAALENGQGMAVGNAGIVDLGGGTLVFDTFLTPAAAQILRTTAEEVTGNPVRWVLNSHFHNDHIRGNQVFAPDATIISTAIARQQILQDGLEELQWDTEAAPQRATDLEHQLEAETDPQARIQLRQWVNYFRAIADSLDTLALTPPDTTFESTLHLHGSRRTATFQCAGGGHTASDAILVIPDAQVAFMGDLLFVNNHPYLAGGDPEEWLRQLRLAKTIDATRFVPGHGPTGTARDIDTLITYLEQIMTRAQQFVQAGASVDDAAAAAMPEAYADWGLAPFYATNMRFLHGYYAQEADF